MTDTFEMLCMSKDGEKGTYNLYESIANSKGFSEGSEIDIDSRCPHKPRVVNIVVCVDYSTEINLYKLGAEVKNCEYNPNTFSAATFRMAEPRCSALIFSNGKVNIVGCCDKKEAKIAVKKLARLFSQLGIEYSINNFRVVNVVATADLKFPIRLENIAEHKEHSRFIQYNPEIFSGLVYHLAKPKCTILLFVSGKLIITGAKSERQVVESLEFIYPILLSFRDKKPIPRE